MTVIYIFQHIEFSINRMQSQPLHKCSKFAILFNAHVSDLMNSMNEVFFANEVQSSTLIMGKRRREKPRAKRFACDECGKKFSFECRLKSHKQKHANKCKYCSKELETESKLKRHTVKHQPEDDQFECDICEPKLSFIRKSTYLKHMEVHESLFQCPKCPKQFKSKITLKVHMLKHDGPPNLPCALCTSKFYTNQDLKQHIKRTHHGSQIHKCPECSKKLKSKHNLKNHMLMHNGPPPFSCEMCDKKYYATTTVKRHQKKKHRNQMNEKHDSSSSSGNSSGNSSDNSSDSGMSSF